MPSSVKKTFGHTAEPWKTQHILAKIATADGNPEAVATARQNARTLYAQYRKDGGESYETGAQWCRAVATTIQQGTIQDAKKQLEQVAHHPQAPPEAHTLAQVLLAILSGDRSLTLADTPGLRYADAVEIERLLKTLSP